MSNILKYPSAGQYIYGMLIFAMIAECKDCFISQHTAIHRKLSTANDQGCDAQQESSLYMAKLRNHRIANNILKCSSAGQYIYSMWYL